MAHEAKARHNAATAVMRTLKPIELNPRNREKARLLVSKFSQFSLAFARTALSSSTAWSDCTLGLQESY